MDTETLDLVGAITAMVIYASSIVTFAGRLAFGLGPGHWIGIPVLVAAIPLAYLLVSAPGAGRLPLYYLQVGLMLTWILGLFVLDYWLGVPWREERWQLVCFITLYFAGLGGMIGVSFLAGRAWGIAAVILFAVAGTLAFVQRALTGV